MWDFFLLSSISSLNLPHQSPNLPNLSVTRNSANLNLWDLWPQLSPSIVLHSPPIPPAPDSSTDYPLILTPREAQPSESGRMGRFSMAINYHLSTTSYLVWNILLRLQPSPGFLFPVFLRHLVPTRHFLSFVKRCSFPMMPPIVVGRRHVSAHVYQPDSAGTYTSNAAPISTVELVITGLPNHEPDSAAQALGESKDELLRYSWECQRSVNENTPPFEKWNTADFKISPFVSALLSHHGPHPLRRLHQTLYHPEQLRAP